MTDPIDEARGRVPVTDGVVKAMVRYGAARQCPSCQFGVPRYPGRYPKLCPRCGDELQITKEHKARTMKESVDVVPVLLTSRSSALSEVIAKGRQSFGPYGGDETCSRRVAVPYQVAEEAWKDIGGLAAFKAGFEHGLNGSLFRMEESEDPVIIAEFDDTNRRALLFATSDPSRYLGADPRADIVQEDHEGTFEPLAEGVLKAAADRAIGLLRSKLSKLWDLMSTLRTVKLMWDEAQHAAGTHLLPTAVMRMAQHLDGDIKSAFAGVHEGWAKPRLPKPTMDESEVTLISILGLALGALGGIPLLLGALSKAAKWLGFPSVSHTLERMHHVAHEIEESVIDVIIPSELSYQLYLVMWARGWRIGRAMGRASKLEKDKPLAFENYLNDKEFHRAIEMGMYRLLVLFFFVNGAIHLVAAPLSALFATEGAAEVAAVGVKGVELGQGISRAAELAAKATSGAARAAKALESVDPERVRMVDIGSDESINPAGVQLYVSEADARDSAAVLGVALDPSARLVGGETMWTLVHESGLALGVGEPTRLMEFFGSGPGSPSYDAAIRNPEQIRARQRARDSGHERVAGAFAEDKRASARRPRKPGEGPTQVRGGFRIHVGSNEERKPNKDVQKSLQNTLNAKRGLRARISGAKKWHRSREGNQLHRTLANYNREDVDTALRAKILDIQDRIISHNAGQQRAPVNPGTVGMGESLSEDMGTLRPRSAGGTEQMNARGPQTLDHPLPDDHLEAILRRLIVTQNMDVLQDVEFDDVTGSIYLFFDPVLRADEIDEVVAAIRQERGDIQLISSPDMSLPGESVESDWWVLFLAGPNETAVPDPAIYAKNPDDYATKVQAVVMSKPSPPEAVASGINVRSIMNAAGS